MIISPQSTYRLRRRPTGLFLDESALPLESTMDGRRHSIGTARCAGAREYSILLRFDPAPGGVPSTHIRLTEWSARIAAPELVGVAFGHIVCKPAQVGTISAAQFFDACDEFGSEMAETGRILLDQGIYEPDFRSGAILVLRLYDFTASVNRDSARCLRAIVSALKKAYPPVLRAILVAEPVNVQVPESDAPTPHLLAFMRALKRRTDESRLLELHRCLGPKAKPDYCATPVVPLDHLAEVAELVRRTI